MISAIGLSLFLFLFFSSASFAQETGIPVSSQAFISASSETVKTDSPPADIEAAAAPAETSVLLDSIKKTLEENPSNLDEKKKNMVLYELTSAGEKIDKIISGGYEDAVSTAGFREALDLVRKALSAYYVKNGRRPRSLEELIPAHLPYIPVINTVAGYGNGVKYIRNASFDKNYRAAVDGSSAYLYFSDPQSVHYGLVIINSSGRSEEGEEYCAY
ncbi:MAG: hypothetical protein COT17_06180 [Elusimicrobia bacterium CG08_land_8_20_14_0_20_51_18]|nr:MAG: hypothetical protein COT17_06180 [Elusimicrobia bacterium CG08_land_8_20_14_0_20_51_18]